MNNRNRSPKTRISYHTTDAIYVRGANLVDELIGKLTFTEMMYFQLLGKRPTAAQTRILNAVLVTLMEHGLTPSVIATRMIYNSCPEAVQAAVAAGLLGAVRFFIGTMEGCATVISHLGKRRAKQVAQRFRAAKQPVGIRTSHTQTRRSALARLSLAPRTRREPIALPCPPPSDAVGTLRQRHGGAALLGK